MAEPTDINKNKSTASAMVDALRVELKELQRFDTVDPEVLGGKAGKPIPVPKKFTADQIVSFMKQFPKMFPLANENAYFGIARALTIESPDLFDIPSFEEYEKKYGDVMEMQEKGGLASKYIETAKESTPANDPMPASKTTTGPSMADSVKDPTQITLREAAEMYGQQIGTKKITRFTARATGPAKKYANVTLAEAFAGKKGERIIDKMLDEVKSPNAKNSLMDDLRLISIPVSRAIRLENPNSPILNTLPGAEAADEQTKTIFGERLSVAEERRIAVFVDKKPLGEFINQLEAIASDPKNPKAGVAEAILTTVYTGPRAGLVAGLQGSEYIPERGAIYVQPQTKEKLQAGEKGRTGAQKTGGVRKKAIPYTVPLSESGQASIQRQLKRNAADPDVVKFLEQQIKNKNAPIFVYKDDKGKVKQVTTSVMSELLADIQTSSPIIIDNVTGEEFNSLYPKSLTNKEAGKWGAALLRNIHASVSLNALQLPGNMVDFLQGRSETSGAEGRSTTKKLKYAERPRGQFFPEEQEGQQRVANWLDEAAGKVVSKIPDVETRVTKATYSIPGFLDPVVSEEAVVTEPVEKLSPDELKQRMSAALAKIDPSKLKYAVPIAIGKGVAGLGMTMLDPVEAAATVVAGPTVGGAASLITMPTEAARDKEEVVAEIAGVDPSRVYQMDPEVVDAIYQDYLDEQTEQKRQLSPAQETRLEMAQEPQEGPALAQPGRGRDILKPLAEYDQVPLR